MTMTEAQQAEAVAIIKLLINNLTSTTQGDDYTEVMCEACYEVGHVGGDPINHRADCPVAHAQRLLAELGE